MVRLAYEQGVLQQRSVNPYQWWALTYMMSFKRWFLSEVRDDFLKRFLAITDPKRYVEVYAPPLVDAFGQAQEELPISPHEFDDIDDYLTKLDKVRTVSGADFDDDGDGDWQ